MTPRLAPGFRIGASFEARFDGAGARLATLGKRITLWDVARRTRVATGPALSHASSVDFSPDGRHLVAKNTSGDVLVMGVPDLDERARFSGHAFGEGTDIRFTGDGNHLVDGTWSGLLTVRDAVTGNVEWQEAGDSIFRLACTRDRKTWVYDRWSRERGSLVVRRWPFDENLPEPVPEVQGVSAVAISDDARQLAVGARSLKLLGRTTDVDDWQTEAEIDDLSRGGSDALSWSPDGTSLAYTGAGWAAVVDGDLRLRHRQELRYVSDADFSPTGTLVAFGDWSAGLVLAWPPPNS